MSQRILGLPLSVDRKTCHPSYLLSIGNGTRYDASFSQDAKNKLPPASISSMKATFIFSSIPALFNRSHGADESNLSSQLSTSASLSYIAVSLHLFSRLVAITRSIYHTDPHQQIFRNPAMANFISHRPTPHPISAEIHLKELGRGDSTVLCSSFILSWCFWMAVRYAKTKINMQPKSKGNNYAEYL